MATNLPYLSGKYQILPNGYLAKNVTQFDDGKVIGYPLYFNGDYKASRFFNAYYNDYAEAIETKHNYAPKEVVIDNKTYQGVCSNTFGRCTGNGNTIVGLMGRVDIITKEQFKLGDVLYYDTETKEIKKANNFEETKGNIIGKVLKVNNFFAQVLIM